MDKERSLFMDRNEFSSLFKDLLAHLYDRASVETHPLAARFPLPPRSTSHRAEAIQSLIFSEIEQLRPGPGEPEVKSPEWRPYLILYRRYVEGREPAEIAASLFISERQFRRDHSRAAQALSMRVWERYFEPSGQSENNEPSEFDLNIERLDLHEVLKGVLDLITPRLASEAARVHLDLSPVPPIVMVDRILLRQILLNLFNVFFHLHSQPDLNLHTRLSPAPLLRAAFEMQADRGATAAEAGTLIREMSRRLHIQINEKYPPPGGAGQAEISLSFPPSPSKTILIIDDQAAALRMYQRYLSRTGLEVIGIGDPAQALQAARDHQPALIVLDVMMPRLDGWEVLQALKVDPALHSIPIVVCSAWAEPDLAKSLGAVTFLKKPIFQKDLLEVLLRFGLIES
jgi:CheY-like chemotaxis protein